MVYWNLVEMDMKLTKKNTPTKKRGWWKITQVGIEFVRMQRRIPKWIKTYNSEIVEVLEGETTNIRECLGEKFDYDELMGR